jgi:hypothetical protein
MCAASSKAGVAGGPASCRLTSAAWSSLSALTTKADHNGARPHRSATARDKEAMCSTKVRPVKASGLYQ